jgi:hypothetical protein
LPELRFVDGVGEALLAEDVGEVDQGTGEAGDRDVVDGGAVLVVDQAGAVEGEAVLRDARARSRDLDPLGTAQDSP